MSLKITDNVSPDNQVGLQQQEDGNTVKEQSQPEQATEGSIPTTSANLSEAQTGSNLASAQKAMLLAKLPANGRQTNKIDPVKTTPADSSNDGRETIYIPIPPGRENLSDYNLLFATAEHIYQQAGIRVSKAAIEEAVGIGFIFEKQSFVPDFVRDQQGKVVPDENGQPIPAYLITIEPEAKEALLNFRAEAERITQTGLRAVHDMTEQERWETVKQIFRDKYADQTQQKALDEIFSAENLGMLTVTKMIGATAAAPFVAMGMTAKFAVVDLPQLRAAAIEIKRLTYAPQKPSDLDLAARRLADLIRRGEVMLGTAALDKGVNVAAGLADSALSSTRVNTGPSAPAVVTPEGYNFKWRMPAEESIRPAVPNSGVEVGSIPGFSAITGDFGGPTGKSEPIQMPVGKDYRIPPGPAGWSARPWSVKPSLKPDENNKPAGIAEQISKNTGEEEVRGVKRENEAAITLAKDGYFVEQKPQLTDMDRNNNPWFNEKKKPDYKIEGEIFDCYSPAKNTSAQNILSYIKEKKVDYGQTRRIVLNLDDSNISLDELRTELQKSPILNLQQIIVVKDGKATPLFPFDK
jgi:hypothetical protein